jgi:RNA polymerase sigma-32 factor
MRQSARTAVQPLLRQALSNAQSLSADRERELLTRYHATQDKAAMDELVRSHMPIIFRVAGRSARNPGIDINDLVQTATEGLLVAINRWSFEKSDASGLIQANEPVISNVAAPVQASTQAFEEDSGCNAAPALPRSSRLATYAMWWMRVMLTNSVIENRGMVVRAKNPKVRKALFNLPLAVKKLDITLPLAGSDVGRIATYLGVGEQDIKEALIHAAGDVMLDDPIGDGSVSRGDITPDERTEGEDGILNRLASTERWSAVCQALMALPPRERFVLIARYLLTHKWKLDRLSGTLMLSRERIRLIANDSLGQIQRSIGPADVKYNPAPHRAVADLDALVSAIEHASTSADPADMELFLRNQQVTTGPTRITKPRSTAAQASSAHHLLPPPTLAPELHLTAA